MTVAGLLAAVSSRELSEWEAYERHAGPLDTVWQDEVMAGIHEQLQQLNRLQGAAHFTDKKHTKNPAPEPKHYPRPRELYERDEDQEPDQEQEEAD
jgi:hypothetical protein